MTTTPQTLTPPGGGVEKKGRRPSVDELRAANPHARNLAHAVYLRWRVLVHEVAKFGVVGVVAYIVDVGVSNVLHLGLGVGPLTSKAASTVMATVVSYLGNRHWSFRHRARTGARRELSLFALFNGVGLVITLIPVAFVRYVLGLKGGVAFNISGNLIGTGLATLFRFWAYKRFVFLAPDTVGAVVADIEDQHDTGTGPASDLPSA